jgi:uncharacterized protein (TIGR02145 family)
MNFTFVKIKIMKKLCSFLVALFFYASAQSQIYVPGVTLSTLAFPEWMPANLNVTTYRNGDNIPQVTDPAQWAALTTGAWCYYNNNPANGPVYGRLYNWYAVNDPRGLAPQGWHIPTDAEWTSYCSGIGCGALKETGTTHWRSPNIGATNYDGFGALPGGMIGGNGGFFGLGTNGIWWTSTPAASSNAWMRTLVNNSSYLSTGWCGKNLGLSVRCIKDKKVKL